MTPNGIITLLTDFGLIDPYVGIMKGVILSISAKANIIDITHQIPPGAIAQAAMVLEESYPFFPRGSIHVAIVDPGVGTSRRAILFVTENRFFLGPDNGLLWPIISSHPNGKIIHLTEKKFFLPFISQTFHGRDIFAPVAAHLCKGVDPLKMGTIIDNPVRLSKPGIKKAEKVLVGMVTRIDNFGNLITNISERDLKEFLGPFSPIIKISDIIIKKISRTYSDVEPGELLALIGSSGFMEISVNLGRACDRLTADHNEIVGTRVEVFRGPDSVF